MCPLPCSVPRLSPWPISASPEGFLRINYERLPSQRICFMLNLLMPSSEAHCTVLCLFNAFNALPHYPKSTTPFPPQMRAKPLACSLPRGLSARPTPELLWEPTTGAITAPQAHLGDRVVDIDGRHLQDPVGHHLVQVVDPRCGLFGDASDA